MDRKATLTDCGDCSRWKEVRQRMRISELLTAAMASFEEKEFNPSLAEYLKLLQLEREFEDDEPKEITVTWVEPEERSSAER
jgi:hypothetical protein